MDIIDFIGKHTFMSAIIIIILFIFIRFYIIPKFFKDNSPKLEEPFNTKQYDNIK